MLKVRKYIFAKVWEESVSVQCRFYCTLVIVILSSLHAMQASENHSRYITAVYLTSLILENEKGVFRYIGPAHPTPSHRDEINHLFITISLNFNF